MKMNRGIVVGLAVAMGLLLAGVAYAWGPWGGCGYRMGYGMGYQGSSNVQSMQRYQKETLGLRDELMTKYAELQTEQSKPLPDTNRIATLRKEIVDLQTRIQDSAGKYGVPAWGPMGGGMMARGMMGPGMMGTWGCPMWAW
jgi:hypothetical protein